MIGITNGINKKSSDFETINVTLNTNQQSHADIFGVNFTLTYGNYTQTFAWKGSALTIEVPAFVEYTLSFEGVEGYLKPADASYTAQAENSRSVTFTYKTELVQVTVNSDNGASVSGAKVNINGKQQTWNGSILTQKVPFGTSYTVSVGEMSGFSTPASKSFKAEQAVRELSFTYIASALKVNILSNQSTESSWDPTITNIKATVKYGSTTLQVSNGQQINLPSGVNVTITFPEVEGYKNPDDIVFTHNGGLVEKSGTYKCELLTVNVSADSGSVSGFEVTISKKEVVGVATKYTKLEYIESTGTQYIDTGFVPNQDTRVVMDVQLMSTSTSHLFGARTALGENSYFVACISGTSVRADFNTQQNTVTVQSVTDRTILDFNKTKFVFGSSEAIFSYATFTPNCHIYLFGSNTSGVAASNGAKMKMYSCKIYDNGILVRDYTPALRSDGIAGLYDSVNDTFTASSGSGNFSYNSNYEEVVAIQTSVTGTYKIPFDSSCTITASNVTGYSTPAPITRVASSKSYTASMQYTVIKVVDLSLFDVYGNPIQRSTANCYVIREAGQYKFPIVYGNAIKNGKVNTAAFTNNGSTNSHDFVDGLNNIIKDSYITFAHGTGLSYEVVNSDMNESVEILGTEGGAGILSLLFKVTTIPQQGGNVIISVSKNTQTIWSWHIWLWPHDLTPVEITNSTGVKYNIMPVNLASKYDADGVHIKNWFYQWGRPNPMLLPSAWNSTTDHSPGSINKEGKASGLAAALKWPTTFFCNSSTPYNWFGDKSYYNLWDAACTDIGNSDNDTVKTVYDPCPVGWKVPNGNTFTGLSVIRHVNGIVYMSRYSTDNTGMGLPISGSRSPIDGSLAVGYNGYLWTSASSANDFVRYFTYNTYSINVVDNIRARGLSIRPVEDDLTKIDTI